MPYGIIKVDQVTFTNAGVDQTISVSGIVASISGNITATGTISGNVIRGGTTVSGATVTGTAGQFGTITGNTAGFTTVTGTTVTGTTANFVTVSGTTVTGNVGNFTTVTGGSAGFTTVTGTTITGTTLTVASGTFTGNSTAAAFIPTGSTVPTNGVYLPSANNVAISTNGSGRLFVDASGRVGMGAAEGTYAASVTTTGNNGFLVKTGTASAVQIYAGNTGGEAALGTLTSDPLNLVTAGSSRIRITSAGLVGIGTSSPDANSQLHIVGSSYQPLYVNTTNAGGGGAAFFRSGTQALYVGTAGSSWLSGSSTADGLVRAEANLVLASNGNTRAVTIDTSQRVGIGTASPGSLLTSYPGNVSTLGAKASTGLLIDNNGSAGNISQIGLGYTFSNTYHPISIAAVTTSGTGSTRADLVFAVRDLTTDVAPTERARIDSSGRLLVGTSTNTGGSLFQVNDNRIRIATAKTPASATDTGSAGEICWDANYIYVCTATNTWKRAALSTW